MKRTVNKYLLHSPIFMMLLMVAMYFVHLHVPIHRAFIMGWFVVALVALWSNDWKIEPFGIYVPNMSKWIAMGMILGAFLFLWLDIVVLALCEKYLGSISHSNYNFFKNDFFQFVKYNLYLFFITNIMTIFGQFSFLTRRLAVTLGDTWLSWIGVSIVVSVYSGVVTGGDSLALVGFFTGLHLSFRAIYIFHRDNSLLISLVALAYNLITTTMIYLDVENTFREFIQILLDFFS